MKADYTVVELHSFDTNNGDNRQMKADYTTEAVPSTAIANGDNRQMKADYTMYESVEKKSKVG